MKKNLRVIHLIKTSVGATWALKQIEQLIGLGCEIHVVLPNDAGLSNVYKQKGAIVHILNVDVASLARKPINFIKSLYKFRKLLQAIQPDLVHSHFVGTTLFMRIAMIGMRIKRIFQVPGPLHLEKKLTRNLEIKMANKYDYWIPTCNFSKQIYLKSGIPDKKLTLSFYGTDTNIYSQKNTGILRTEFSIPEEKKIVGMIAYAYAPKKWLGQTRGLKGHEDLIDAMALVIEKDPDVLCVIVGGAWGGAHAYYQSIVDYGKRKLGDKVLFLGTRKDIPYLYPDIDVVVHPSHSENLGGAAESLLMAVPTIATNIGGFPDIVKPGETGWLVPKQNPVALAETISVALADPVQAKKLADEGEKQLVTALDVKNTSKQVFNFYKTTLGI